MATSLWEHFGVLPDDGLRRAGQFAERVARAVAGGLVASDGPAVLQVHEYPDGVLDDAVRRLGVQAGHEAHAAGVVFLRGSYRPRGDGKPPVLIGMGDR